MIGVVWHIWIGVALAGLAVTLLAGVIAYYFLAVERKKYPTGKQRRRRDL